MNEFFVFRVQTQHTVVDYLTRFRPSASLVWLLHLAGLLLRWSVSPRLLSISPF